MGDASNDTPIINAAQSTRRTSRPRSRPAAHGGWKSGCPLSIVALDQLTKAIVRSQLTMYSSVTILPGFVNLTHVRNTGAAFGFLNATDFPLKTVLLAVIAMAR